MGSKAPQGIPPEILALGKPSPPPPPPPKKPQNQIRVVITARTQRNEH